MKNIGLLILGFFLLGTFPVFSKGVPDIGYVDRMTCFLMHPLMNSYSPGQKEFIFSENGRITPEALKIIQLKKEYAELLKYQSTFIQSVNAKIASLKSNNGSEEEIQEIENQFLVDKKNVENRITEISLEFEKKGIQLNNFFDGEKQALKIDTLKKINDDIREICESLRKKYKLRMVADSSFIEFNQLAGNKISRLLKYTHPQVGSENAYLFSLNRFKEKKDDQGFILDLSNWMVTVGDINNSVYKRECGKLILKNGKNLTHMVLKTLLSKGGK